MAVYKITRFAASDMDKVGEITESIRDLMESVSADFIDFVSYGNGKGVVIARYPDQATMDAATEATREVFGKMTKSGVVDGDSVHPHTGVVFKTF
jgi:phosphosulfolactate synthase (CoM biosynthesis protein A)